MHCTLCIILRLESPELGKDPSHRKLKEAEGQSITQRNQQGKRAMAVGKCTVLHSVLKCCLFSLEVYHNIGLEIRCGLLKIIFSVSWNPFLSLLASY